MAVLAGLVMMALVAVVFLLGLYLVHRVAAVASDPFVALPFQSGWQPEEHALSRYHVRWYLPSLLFLAFDIEMLFMYPWALPATDTSDECSRSERPMEGIHACPCASTCDGWVGA